MSEYSIYRDISRRNGGDVYIGVVGPVRTGKSTFIKKFMELLVIPNIENVYGQERAVRSRKNNYDYRTEVYSERGGINFSR